MDAIAVAEEKDRLRASIASRRLRADDHWREEASKRITERAIRVPALSRSPLVSVFVSRGTEVDTAELISWLLKEKGRIAVPRVVGERDLDLHEVDDFPVGFVSGSFGILEPDPEAFPHTVDPADVGVVFVPGIAFDRKGNRIGYGRGFYDTLLAKSPKALKVGIGFSFQLLDAVPEENHDIQLDAVITEIETLTFRA